MMELPRALAPWSEYLNLLPRDLIRKFGPMVQRLDLAIGPLRVQSQSGTGEPDGFDGIARRGSYERLLLSEWLLAEEIPEEFARRAAMTEHAFLQQARQDPAGARVSVALFDAGPNQLGSPRLAHLATLIVLARRAEAAGARFEWGLLQQPRESPQVGVTAAYLRVLFNARSAREASEEDIALSRERVGSTVAAEDLWIVGGRRLTGLSSVRGASLLTISEPIDESTRSLEARVSAAGRTSFEITLDLPDQATCIRLIRDPIQAPPSRESVREKRSLCPTSNLLFLPGGTKLLGRLSREHVGAYPVPNSPHAGEGKTKVLMGLSRYPIVAAGRFLKNYAVVTTTDEPGRLRIEWIVKSGHSMKTGVFRLPASVPPPTVTESSPLYPLLPLYGPAQPGSGDCIDSGWLAVINGTLLHIVPDLDPGKTPVAEIECSPVTAVVQSLEGVAWIGEREGEWMLAAVDRSQARHIYQRFGDASLGCFGGGGVVEHPAYRLAAVKTSTATWCAYSQDRLTNNALQTAVTRFSTEKEVVGVYGLAGQMKRESGLILLEPDRRSLSYLHSESSGPLLAASSEIVQVTVSPYSHGGTNLTNIAYLTVRGELVIYSLTYRAIVYRMQFPERHDGPTA